MTSQCRPDVDRVLSSLKDFQRASVDCIMERLFAGDRSGRFLLADEVGLGKTMVARGVIARVVDQLWDRKDRIDIAYICSNAEIARQNINRLNITRDSQFQRASRLTLLPLEVRNLQKNRLNFISLTPGTSFHLKSNLGTATERWLLYWLLRRAWPRIDGPGPMNVLEGNMARRNFRAWIRDYETRGVIDPSLRRAFIRKLREHDQLARERGEVTYRRRYRELSDDFRYKKQGQISQEMRWERASFIGDVRGLLAASCIGALEPDLIILDEFQRFKELLRDDSDSGHLAKHLFESQDARVLLLSATPYKMYTLNHERESDDHYADFLSTLGFLFSEQSKTKELEGLLRTYRTGLYQLAEGGGESLDSVRGKIEQSLRTVMARTERLAVTADRDGMLREVRQPPAELESQDVRAYAQLQRLARLLDHGSVIEYWKSAPYLLNFMEQYDLKRRFSRHINAPQLTSALKNHLLQARQLFLAWKSMESYKEIDPANPRLRRLLQDTVNNGSWQLLWLAPSLPYHQLDTPFDDARRRGMTKRLIFSSWHVVPRALSSLLSYEAERQMMLMDGVEDTDYASYAQRKPLLNITRSQGRLTGMPVLSLLYPSTTLALLGDPLEIMQQHSGAEPLRIASLLGEVRKRLATPLRRLAKQYGDTTAAREDERWYWAAPILLDLEDNAEATRQWWDDDELAECWSGGAGEEGWAAHIEEARDLLAGNVQLGRMPENLVEVLAKQAVAGPAVCALRALSRVAAAKRVAQRARFRHVAGQIAWGFRSLFNLPTSINLLRGMNRAEPYWERVLDYCLAGCLQSVLDEYAHMLRESLGLIDSQPDDAAEQIGDAIATVAGLHAATPQVDVIDVGNSRIRMRPQRLRARYAMRFGEERSDEMYGQQAVKSKRRFRGDEVRWAFNSPFRPFVLITTSVGQEGLDFHPYCHAVVHWNLPSNPVDLEQREGRVHRYKGHAVRRNIAQSYGGTFQLNGQADPWQALFDLAASEPGRESDLTPYWVYPNGDAAIERHVPVLPMSREIGRLSDLRRSLAVYRMVFGQPRQSDLLAHLLERASPDDLHRRLSRLRIDLTPATRTQS